MKRSVRTVRRKPLSGRVGKSSRLLRDESFRLLVTAVKDYAIFMLDPQGRIATWNPGAEALKGYRADEAIGQHVSIFYTPEDAAAGRFARLLKKAREVGRVEDEGWRVRKDGSRFWADVVITAIRDESGELLGYAKVTRDLTDRRRTEEALRLSEQRFRLMVDSVRDYAIFLLDPGGRVMTWNAGSERLAGFRAEEVLGKHFSVFYPPEALGDRGTEHADLELQLAASHGRFEDQGWRVRKDGARFWADVILSPVRDSTRGLGGFVQVMRDLTQTKLAQEETVRLAKAQEALRLRDEFVSIASHELKTPLTSLKLQLQSLADQLTHLDPKLALRLERVNRSVDRLATLVETLLDVSRLASGRFSLKLEQMDLVEQTREVIAGFGEEAHAAGAAISLWSPPQVVGTWDPLRIEQITSNLLGNALKYAPGKPIDVTIHTELGSAYLSVEDRGPGIPWGDMARIFGRFERAASSRHYGGLGLGLYVAKQLAEAHGGTVEATNREGGGAKFVVRLPLHGRAG